ncbi:MAG: hypothetical protein ACLSWM_08155 [Barnesiella sp.]|nr:hypothetical protein [Barnesiella propionica]MCU6768399.1 hypothetical protein [Barnesiella propionica]
MKKAGKPGSKITIVNRSNSADSLLNSHYYLINMKDWRAGK